MNDSLVVTSKVKKFIKANAALNTSAEVSVVLTDKIKVLVTDAIAKAQADGRKTVMARDFV